MSKEITEVYLTDLIKEILKKQGKDDSLVRLDQDLKVINFRSLDFSELCLRVEDEIGKELVFDASNLRKVDTVKDVIDFVTSATN